MKRVRGFNIDDEHYEMLEKMANAEKRSCSNMLEILIELVYKMKGGEQ